MNNEKMKDERPLTADGEYKLRVARYGRWSVVCGHLLRQIFFRRSDIGKAEYHFAEIADVEHVTHT